MFINLVIVSFSGALGLAVVLVAYSMTRPSRLAPRAETGTAGPPRPSRARAGARSHEGAPSARTSADAPPSRRSFEEELFGGTAALRSSLLDPPEADPARLRVRRRTRA